jgi:hypothetical protein
MNILTASISKYRSIIVFTNKRSDFSYQRFNVTGSRARIDIFEHNECRLFMRAQENVVVPTFIVVHSLGANSSEEGLELYSAESISIYLISQLRWAELYPKSFNPLLAIIIKIIILLVITIIIFSGNDMKCKPLL